jgi:hypothetical protein
MIGLFVLPIAAQLTVSEQCRNEFKQIQDQVTQGCFNRRFDTTDITFNELLPYVVDGLSSICSSRCIESVNSTLRQAESNPCASQLVQAFPPLLGRDVGYAFRMLQAGICVQENREYCLRDQYTDFKFIDFDSSTLFTDLTDAILQKPALFCTRCFKSQIDQMNRVETTPGIRQPLAIMTNFGQSLCGDFTREIKAKSSSVLQQPLWVLVFLTLVI